MAELVFTFLCVDTVRPGFCVLSILFLLFHLFTLLAMTYYNTFVWHQQNISTVVVICIAKFLLFFANIGLLSYMYV